MSLHHTEWDTLNVRCNSSCREANQDFAPAWLAALWPAACPLHAGGAVHDLPTDPASLDPRARPVAVGSDTVEHLRMIWWTKYALQHGLNPFYQSLFGYPDGFFSSVQWAQPLVYWPPALLSFVFNPTASFN